MAPAATHAASPRRKAPHRSVDLQCPECTGLVKMAARDLNEGAAVACPHCECEAEVTQDFDDKNGKTCWILVDPLADYDDNDARG